MMTPEHLQSIKEYRRTMGSIVGADADRLFAHIDALQTELTDTLDEAKTIRDGIQEPLGHGCDVTMVITQTRKGGPVEIINPNDYGAAFEKRCKAKCEKFAAAMRLTKKIAETALAKIGGAT
jgi:hypothetical protein